MAMNPALFKAYDVRGLVPEQWGPAEAEQIGRAIPPVLGVGQVCVGRDMRVSSPEIAAALIRGITAAGADVVDIGAVSSDALYFSVGKYGYESGVMVTASHNPAGYNGVKMCRANAIPVSDESGLLAIRDMVVSGAFPPATRTGSITERKVLDDFAAHCLSFIDPASIRPLKLVVDAGNGMAGKVLPRVFSKLSQVTLVPMYFELDGTFPHHDANPLEQENIADLKARVIAEKADLGAAFDGDADRMFLVTEQGEFVGGDMTTALVATALLRRHPDAAIVYNLICSRGVPEAVEQAGGRPIRARVGHSFIKQVMREQDAIFGGEHSGHFYFRDNWYADSGLIALLSALDALSVENVPLSEALAPLDHRVRSGEINSEVRDVRATEQKIEAHYRDQPGAHLDHLDGLTVNFPDWWFNVRPSNTQPLLRLNVEADTPALLDQKKREVMQLIRSDEPMYE
ncbi:MAG: phosphomannomutase/phosphoglucomutase [Thermomicrobia bacterium]|nr:phosphomannomutase/phosphoglucomutase [Thermomicrobia bacterium]